jgi:alanyl-tRNA synthetase
VARYKQTAGSDGSLEEGLLVLDVTPFYAESGGQVGDTGEITTASGARLTVEDTFTWNEMVVHKVRAETAISVSELQKPLHARIASEARSHTRRNHSVTHLLQAALRKVLGEHVTQSGSRVAPDGLRFDFTHMKGMTPEEIARVEELVNTWVLQDLPITTEIKSPEEAKREGATALFGEKYGESVRVVTMGAVSKELCGGTHASSTGTIGLFHITAESSIAAGIRRIEAITGMGSLDYLRNRERTLSELTGILKVKENALPQRINDLLSQIKELENEVADLSQKQAGKAVDSLFEAARQGPGPFPWVVKNMGSMDKKQFGSLTNSVSDAIRDQGLEEMVVVLAADVGGKALFAASAGKAAVDRHGVHCGEMVKTAAQKAGGGGGGSPVRAQAGAKDATMLQDALDAVAALLEKKADHL